MSERDHDELIDAQEALAEAEDRLGDVWDELDEIHDLLDMWDSGPLFRIEEAQASIVFLRRSLDADIGEIDRQLDEE